MDSYAVAFFAVLLVNLLPAFAPPTWTLLVYFALQNQLEPPYLIALGITAAASGRYVLAHAFRAIRPRLPKGYVQNMENLGSQLTRNSGKLIALITLFFFSPLSSAQLFEAAGLMQKVKLIPITLAFAAGRIVTYSTYVYGASEFAKTDIGSLISDNLTSPWMIAGQIAMLIALIWIGQIKWKSNGHHPEKTGISE